MTTQEYIASGILELYATGGLPANEHAEVEILLLQHPEMREELNQIEVALENYAQMHATDPPATLKAKILNTIQAMPGSVKIEPISGPEPKPEPAVEKIIPISQPATLAADEKRPFNWLSIAATILLLVSAGLNYYFYKNWQNAEGNLQIALNQQQEIAKNYQQAKFELVQTEKALHVLEDLDTKHVVMQGLAKSPGSEAVIHWDPKSKMVLLEVKKLPVAAAGRQYQLWALKDGKPINAGLFNPADTLMGIQHMKTIQDAEAFALTLEPLGGSESPTLDEMYTMGKM